MGLILILILSALYVVKGLYTLEESGKTVLQILGDGILSASVGSVIALLMRQTGISYGNDDKELISARSFHARLMDGASAFMERLDEFCEAENREARRAVRQRYLCRWGLKYSDCFDGEGAPTGFKIRIPSDASREEKRELRKKKNALKRAEKLKITPLTPVSLSVDGSDENDPFSFGRTEGEYLAKRGGKDIISKALFGILFGYYAIRLTEGAGLEDVLWASFQIGVYLIFGASQMIQAYAFVKTEVLSRIIRKTDLLQKFFRFVGAPADRCAQN